MGTLRFSLLILLAASSALPSEAYRILAVFPHPGKSHYIMFDALLRGLVERGHQVDVISHYELKKPLKNYTTIVNLKNTLGPKQQVILIDQFIKDNNFTNPLKMVAEQVGEKTCELLGHEKIQKFIKDLPKVDPPYDVVLTEAFGTNCYAVFGHLLKIPVIMASSCQEFPWVDDVLGNPDNAAIYSTLLSTESPPFTFWSRFRNTIRTLIDRHRFYVYTEGQTDIMRKHLGPDIPNIRDIEKLVALVLVNTHHAIYGARPTTPALVEVGGLHVEMNDAEFTPELKKWMDESTSGVIYFSLGSILVIESLPHETIIALYAAFSKIAPVRVLIRVSKKELLPPGLPENILTMPWIPQVPVLRHKNTRAFITHTGLMGSQEALYYGVPMICIPFFAEQPLNAKQFVAKKMAIELSYSEISEESMSAALDAILNDPTYREAAKRQSSLFRDRPLSAMDTAVYWIEYIARNGPDAIRSHAAKLHWWQMALLDVYGALAFGVLTVIYLLITVVKYLVRKVFGGKPIKMSKQKQN